jgi:hypothetical protein
VFENKALRKRFGPKWVEITGRCRELHNEKLYDFYPSPNIFLVIKLRRMRWTEHVARMGDRRGAYRALVGRLDGKRSFGRSRYRWEHKIEMDLPEIGWGHGLYLSGSGDGLL